MSSRKGAPKPAHYQGSYHTTSAKLRAAAYANPDARCWRCRKTLAEIRQEHPRARWTAGHVIDGLPEGPLAPECSPCNYAEGSRRRAALQHESRRTSLTW